MTNIECLPDELWLEIFNYIPYVDLFRCFTDLNQRINNILGSKRIKLQVKSNLHYQKSEQLMKTLPEYIIGLSIKYYDQDIDISPYKNLRSLHLSHATIKQLKQIQSNYFQYLNQLSIVVHPNDDYQLGDFLFSKNRLNCLTTCWLPNFDSYFHDDKIYQPYLTLRSLRLNYCHTKTFFKLLSYLPNLNNFESALVPIPNFDQPIPCEHFNLIRLKIFLRLNVPFIDLQTILLNVPCLEQFYLNINRPIIWEEKLDLILLNDLHLLNMKKYDIKINLFSMTIDDLINFDTSI